jgi:hypothetical protein
VIDGTTLDLCPEDTTYNSKTQLCQFTPDVVNVCDDGSQPITNALTGKSECISTNITFHDCAIDEILSNGYCVKQIIVYIPSDNNMTIYKEIYKSCTDDSICKSIDASLVCNKVNGVCQSPIYFGTNYTPIVIAGVIFVTGIVLLIVFSKRIFARRRK